jgi:hypothetical protein
VSTSSGRCLPVQRVNAPRICVGETNFTPVYSRKVCSVVQHPYMSAPIVGADSGEVGALRNSGSTASASALWVIHARQFIPRAPIASPWSGVA